MVIASTIPAAIDALLAAVRAVAPAEVKVVDGFPRFLISNMDLIVVGGQAEPVASGSQSPEDHAFGRAEAYALQVRTTCARGVSTDQKTVRDRAFELMSYVDTAVEQDRSLGGVVRLAELGGEIDLFETDATTAKSGTQAEVAFSVVVQAGV